MKKETILNGVIKIIKQFMRSHGFSLQKVVSKKTCFFKNRMVHLPFQIRGHAANYWKNFAECALLL